MIQVVDEVYTRQSEQILDDIDKIVRCRSIDDVQLTTFSKDHIMKDTDLTGDDAKIYLIRNLINKFIRYKGYDDEKEVKYNKAEKVREEVLSVIQKNNFDYDDHHEHIIYFNSDMDLDQILDLFEHSMNIKPKMVRSSWTTINYLAEDNVPISIGKAHHDNYSYEINIDDLYQEKEW